MQIEEYAGQAHERDEAPSAPVRLLPLIQDTESTMTGVENLLAATPKPIQAEICRSIFDAPDPSSARLLFQALFTEHGEKAFKAMEMFEDMFEDMTSVFALPERYRKRLRTTNGMERLNEEITMRITLTPFQSAECLNSPTSSCDSAGM